MWFSYVDCVEGIMAGYHPDLLLFCKKWINWEKGEASSQQKKPKDMGRSKVRLGKDVIRIQISEASPRKNVIQLLKSRKNEVR